jgi:hypothetical protein
MKKKKFIQACSVGGPIYGKKRTAGKNSAAKKSKTGQKDLSAVYNKFYREQVTALYKAIHHE